MKTFRIYNLNLFVGEVKANSRLEALSKYCNARGIFDRSTHWAELKRP